MKFLFIDTSCSYINIYYLENCKVKEKINFKALKDMSNTILPLVRNLLNKVNVKINDLDKIFVTVGPGSFTGVRIGIAFAKTVSWALSIPVYGISTLEYLSSIDTIKNIIPIIDARRGNVFAGYYDKDLNELSKEKLVAFNDLLIRKEDIVVSFDGVYNSNIYPIDVEKLILKHINDKDINPHELIPNYLKKTEAEEKLNG